MTACFYNSSDASGTYRPSSAAPAGVIIDTAVSGNLSSQMRHTPALRESSPPLAQYVRYVISEPIVGSSQ
jgi:hypothetical protein